MQNRTIVAVIYTVTVYRYVIIYSSLSLSLSLSSNMLFKHKFPHTESQTQHQILHQYKPIVKTKPTKKNPHLSHSIATNIAIATTGASTNLHFTPKPSKTSSHYHQKWRKLSHYRVYNIKSCHIYTFLAKNYLHQTCKNCVKIYCSYNNHVNLHWHYLFCIYFLFIFYVSKKWRKIVNDCYCVWKKRNNLKKKKKANLYFNEM